MYSATRFGFTLALLAAYASEWMDQSIIRQPLLCDRQTALSSKFRQAHCRMDALCRSVHPQQFDSVGPDFINIAKYLARLCYRD